MKDELRDALERIKPGIKALEEDIEKREEIIKKIESEMHKGQISKEIIDRHIKELRERQHEDAEEWYSKWCDNVIEDVLKEQ